MFEPKDSTPLQASIPKPNHNLADQQKAPAANIPVNEDHEIDRGRTAAFLLKSRAIRSKKFGDRKLDIDDISWHILLDLVVATSIGKSVTEHDLAVTHNVAVTTILRYTEYLCGIGLIVKDRDGAPENQVLVTLTATGDAMASEILRKIGQELMNF